MNIKPWACERCRSTKMHIRPRLAPMGFGQAGLEAEQHGALIASCENGHPVFLKSGDVIEINWGVTTVEALFASRD